MSEITEILDRVANSLESKGFLKEAESIDIITNTIEKQAFRYMAKGDLLHGEGDPLYKKIVSAKEALKKGKWGEAHDIISKSMKEMETKSKLFKGVSAVNSYVNLFNKVVKAFIEENQSPGFVIRLLDGVLFYMEEAEEGINRIINSKNQGTQKDNLVPDTETEPFGKLIPARNSELSLAKS